jgi:hypothetical protein
MTTPNLSPDNAAELARWEPLTPPEQEAMRSLWGDRPAGTSEAA